MKIYGFTHSPSVKWYLTVKEYSNGRVESYPRFRRLEEVDI